jgi:hypothetical protein
MPINWISKETLQETKPKRTFPKGFRFADHVREIHGKDGVIAEFTGTGDFNQAFIERRRYEVDAGRDNEPILYTPIYDMVEDANLPKIIPIYRIGPGAFVFEEINEGGEVKFGTIDQSTDSVTVRHWASGFEYSEDLIIYNMTWQFSILERAFGTAHNALLNHLHFYPILNATYPARAKTAASSTGSTLEEKYARTIEDSVTNAKTDTVYPRRGPYDLLIAGGDGNTVERALGLRVQDGANPNPVPAASRIQNVIEYDGWTGTRGKKSTTYAGVTTGKAYLISKEFQMQDFMSFVKQALREQRGDGDLSRFIMEQIVYDSRLAVLANPLHAVEEITWPTS